MTINQLTINMQINEEYIIVVDATNSNTNPRRLLLLLEDNKDNKIILQKRITITIMIMIMTIKKK